MGIIQIGQTRAKLQAYGKEANANDLVINWRNVNIVAKDGELNTKMVRNLPVPYRKINIVQNCKIVGHMMKPDSSMDIAAHGRITQAKHARSTIGDSYYL